MRILNFVLLVTVIFSFQAKAYSSIAKSLIKTANFEIQYQPGQTTRREAKIVGKKAEMFFQRLVSYLGNKPKNRIVISLEGDRGTTPGRRWAFVDPEFGWMHLVRFKEDTYPYQTGLSHELVHAYRFEHLKKIELPPPPAFLFVEEGLAEYLSNVIEPNKETFIAYGLGFDVAAGQWLAAGEGIPMDLLLDRQLALRNKCVAQAYSQQTSFVAFVAEQLGANAILNLAYAADLTDAASLHKYLGDSFASWAKRWESKLLERFKNVPNHEELGRVWRTKMPKADMHVCKSGVEF